MPTVTTTEIISDVLDAVRVKFPFLMRISHQFTNQRLKKGQTAIAHIPTMPSVNEHDAAKGYGHADNTTDAKTLYNDVSITLDQHPEVNLDIKYLNSIADKKQLYMEAIDLAATALGRHIVLYVLGLAKGANFSQKTLTDAVNFDADTLGGIRKAMNQKGAGHNRIGIVNSDVFETLDNDPRITDADSYGQRTGASPLGVLTGVKGFGEIFEYPEMPANGEDINSFFLDTTAVSIMTAVPDDIQEIADSLGIPNIANFEEVTDPESGLTFLAIKWMTPGTFNVNVTLTLLFGAVAGKQNGAAGDKTDFHGHIGAETA